MWQFVEAVEGIAEACTALDVPITGGNVSLYNETDGKAIYPTPIIGVVGLIEDASRVVTRAFQRSGDAIVLLGEDRGEIGGSEYLRTVHGVVAGDAPSLDLAREAALQRLLVDAIRSGIVRSAHDCSDGGIAVTTAECCFGGGSPGCEVTLGGADAMTALFSESASRVVVSVAPADLESLLRLAAVAAVPAVRIGTTGGGRVRIAVGGTTAIDVSVAEAEALWSTAIEKYFQRAVA
jgi:phosphoribosylformylglycinamidine synthase